MSKHILIKDIFEDKIQKQTYTELCFEETSKKSMIVSSKTNFKYDDVCNSLKTSDTIFLFDKQIDFVEFKDVNSDRLGNRKFISELRLKVIESYVTLYNFLNDNSLEISKDELSELTLNYYFVFNREKLLSKPTLLNAFSALQGKWTKHYSRFYKNISFMDNETFIKKYKI
ncbi:hypothetical protein EIB75_04065 [Epilithonimonas vandammei]|uniref:Uncharacterized protein n=1 Tax=Epilithonimonas vandammei TaxID=2487072 RepID=A0A3G8ZKL9_9FLAO|nr:hypothetical protein [Epilithonimonas vandammei]AZI54471.1 hypothetical protein EIB75_04065 [Epilithonimonas vandammei]